MRETWHKHPLSPRPPVLRCSSPLPQCDTAPSCPRAPVASCAALAHEFVLPSAWRRARSRHERPSSGAVPQKNESRRAGLRDRLESHSRPCLWERRPLVHQSIQHPLHGRCRRPQGRMLRAARPPQCGRVRRARRRAQPQLAAISAATAVAWRRPARAALLWPTAGTPPPLANAKGARD